jgi:hypothetical protein
VSFRRKGAHDGFDWSPDGEWIIARAPTNHLELIRVADGLVLELPQFTALDPSVAVPTG